MKRATISDLDDLLDLYRHCSINTKIRYGYDHWIETFDRKMYEQKIHDGLVYVLKDQNKLMGSFILELAYPDYVPERFVNDKQPFRYLKKLAVHPEHQSQGIGTLLMNHAESICKALNVKVLRMDHRTNFKHLKRFYQRLNYQPIGVGYIDDVAVIIIEKHLD